VFLRKSPSGAEQHKASAEVSLCEHHEKRMEAVVKMCLSSTWFERTWVRQEVYAAREIFVQYSCGLLHLEPFLLILWRHGSAVRKESTLWSRIQFLFKHTKFEWPADVAEQSVLAEYLLRPKTRKQPTIPRTPVLSMKLWLELILSGSAFAASNPKDKIYGVLGIIQDLESKILIAQRDPETITYPTPRYIPRYPVDYTKTLGDVYADLVIYIIERCASTGRGLHPLCIFPTRDDESPGYRVLGYRPPSGYASPLSN
jgi:hypothetical protein